ncbi:MAG TPA: TonB-dependent receptor [Gemmatimonadaceae bacterium]
MHEGTVDGYFVNLAKTQRVGIASRACIAFGDGRSLYAAYSYTRATFQSQADIASPLDVGDGNIAEPGDRLPLVPAQQLRAGLDARVARRLSAGIDGRYVGSQWLRGDESNRDRPLDSYVIMDARASLSIERWELTAAVTKLLGRKYAVFGTFNVNEGAIGGPTLERFLTPGAQRAIRISVHRRFGAETTPAK